MSDIRRQQPGDCEAAPVRSGWPVLVLCLSSGCWTGPLHGNPLAPKTAVQTTKNTKHTKNEALTKRAVLTHPAGASVGRNLRQFGYFESFVAAAARSAARTWPGVRRERQAISDGGGTLPRPTGAPVSAPVCRARLNSAGSGTGAPCRHDWPVAGRARGRLRVKFRSVANLSMLPWQVHGGTILLPVCSACATRCRKIRKQKVES